MCGIAGIFQFDPRRPVQPELLDRMTDVLAHRGPDGRGTHIDGSLGLGHRRLAIIDLSDNALQPLSNEDGSVWVVLNGEIYNFQALREELLAKGHRFRSRSDTEVLVHLYEEEGPALVDRLRGMFAFALWDAKQRRLLLARDRFGQKPLYYRWSPDGFHFASELKGILEDPAVPRDPDPNAIHDYLTYGYVPCPRTAFEGIKKLPPAHTLTVDQDGTRRLQRYWKLSLAPKRPLPQNEREEAALEEELLAHLDEATRLRLISDVPLGAFLSGGVDSSAVVASMCAARGGGSSVRTFSIGFEERSYDESAYAQLVADHLGTVHERLVLKRDAFQDLQTISWHYGEPFADASCLPTFAVSKLARRHVTVALSGDGGDELLCGYRRYLGTLLEERVRAAPSLLRSLARNRYLIHALYRTPPLRDLGVELSHSRHSTHLGPADLYLTRVESLSQEQKAQLYSQPFRATTRGRDARQLLCKVISASDGEAFTERCAHADATTYLPDDILVKVDVASMAFGLECRAPLLDHVLAEFVGQLPFALKMRGTETKRILKRSQRGRLPARILKRGKMGFGVPLDHWFRGNLEQTLRETILSKRSLERGYFERAALEKMVDDHVRGRIDYQYKLFNLLMLEVWHQTWVDPPQGSAVPISSAVVRAAG